MVIKITLYKLVSIEILIFAIDKLFYFMTDNEKKYILKCSNYDKIWLFLLHKKYEQHYNTIITFKLCVEFIDINTELSDIEKNIYGEIEKKYLFIEIVKILNYLLPNFLNEMIKSDLDIIDDNDRWVCVNLDSFYSININIDLLEKFRNLNKKNINLYIKKMEIGLIICTLDRIKSVEFYTKTIKKDYPFELKESISFTKGYLICFPPKIVKLAKNYKYIRKIIKRYACQKIFQKKKKLNLIESLSNENFSQPIWLNNNNISLIKNIQNCYNKKLLYKDSKIKICVSVLNFLNSIELSYNKKFLNILTHILNKNTNIHNTLTSKHSLKNHIIEIKKKENNIFLEINENLQSLIQSASILNLIENQIKYYKSFFFTYRLDSRLRIYCYQWPINYQLNHIIRNALIFKKNINILKIWENFNNHTIIKKYIKKLKIFEFKSDIDYIKTINIFFEKNNIYSENSIIEDFKKEHFYQLILKLTNKIKELSVKEKMSIIEDFINTDIKENWEVWLKKLNFKKKKLTYLINYHNDLIDIKNNNFNNIAWADASSNAIQLIILRLNVENDFLLKLVNIKNNDTCYKNIYEYITIKLKEKNHNEILKKIKNILTNNELIELQDIDNNKYLLMPSSYGMGKISYRFKLNNMISNDERSIIWNKLNIEEKKIISDYFWESANEVLIEIGLNINDYKKKCKDIWHNSNYDVFLWKNDLNITIAPINIITSNRSEILMKINKIKIELKNNKTESLEKELEKYKEKLKKDEKDFWKRTMIKSKNQKIFVRVPWQNEYKIKKNKIKQALIPNTIHAYDASIMNLSIQICKKLNIEVLPIHDSIGSNVLTIPLVKQIFKISNILLLEINAKKKIFPFKEKNNISIEQVERISNYIINSKNFFN